jgi:adenosine deaminase
LLRARARLCWFLILISCVAAASRSQAQSRSELRASRYLDSVRKQSPLLNAFLKEMPKGADLHVHLSGAVYAESLIDYAAQDGLCVDHTTSSLIPPPCDPCEKYANKPAVACAYKDHVLYGQMVDAWSMRNWLPNEESGHDHFFTTFDKFSLATRQHTGDMIAEVANRAASDHLQYVELMHTADAGASIELGAKIGWTDDLGELRERLLAGGLKDIVVSTRKKLDDAEAKMRSDLKCGTADAEPGCHITVRYLYQVLRGMPPASVFAQILLGFELAQADPRFVGLNLVMPEDWYVPMHDFDLHMHMLDYLHEQYPKVHISLHAGELAPPLVTPEGLRFHIRESVERGHAERIGHGVDIMYESDTLQLLREMAKKNVLVEICLTSNDMILAVKGDDHPFPIYRKYGVPVTLATDDQGVARGNITAEYVRAAETYKLSYVELKQISRQGLEHSFLPGASLWTDVRTARRFVACAKDDAATKPSPDCQKFLDGSERAKLQWQLENQFAQFEKKIP